MQDFSISDSAISEKVAELLSAVSEVPSACPSLGAETSSAARAIEASASRAAFRHGRLPQMARNSIASAASGLAFRLTQEGPAESFSLARRLVTLALPFAAMEMPEHVAGDSDERPSGWKGSKGGPYRRRVSGALLHLVRRPQLPGGDWTGYYMTAPVCFAATAQAAALAVEGFAEKIAHADAAAEAAAPQPTARRRAPSVHRRFLAPS